MDQFATNGIVVIREAISQKEVFECVDDMWNYIIDLPWKDELRTNWLKIKKDMIGDYWRDLTKDEVDFTSIHYPMTGQFGALTIAPIFHLQTMWDVRQSPHIVDIFKNILQVEKVMVHLDRASFKPPKFGETEFTHWDSNPFYWPDEEYESVQGFLALSDTSFFAVPGTHTDKFRTQFAAQYPNNNRKDQYYVKAVHDPMELQEKVVEYKLKKGDLVIWSNRLLHEAKKNSTKRMRYGYYISYFPHGNPPLILKKKYKGLNKVLEDRINSYKTGTNPKFFQSGTKVALTPQSSFMYHPEKLDSFCSQFDRGCVPYTYKSGKKQGTVVNLPLFDDLEGYYTPPKLTKLGRELIGLQ